MLMVMRQPARRGLGAASSYMGGAVGSTIHSGSSVMVSTQANISAAVASIGSLRRRVQQLQRLRQFQQCRQRLGRVRVRRLYGRWRGNGCQLLF